MSRTRHYRDLIAWQKAMELARAMYALTEERRKLNPSEDAYNPERISGFAFGMGVERIAMILHGVSDIGQFYSGDMRFLEQFA